MIIIAIPKSASTSLMLTLGKYHNMKAKQDFSFSNNNVANGSEILHELHSDIRELTHENLKQLSSDKSTIYKQHIYPSPNNLFLFSNIQKVILLRSPVEIILAYRRGAIKSLHNLLPGYDIKMTENEWLEHSKANGLFADLSFFYNEWKAKAQPENTLFVDYQDYVSTPDRVLNEIEKFYELPITKQKVNTIKARYTRRNASGSFIYWLISKVKTNLTRLMVKLGLKKK